MRILKFIIQHRFILIPHDSLVMSIQQYYKTRFYSRPSDMVYRGYETTLHFGQLLEAHKGNLDGSIGERKFKVFNDFDIQPVFTNREVRYTGQWTLNPAIPRK